MIAGALLMIVGTQVVALGPLRARLRHVLHGREGPVVRPHAGALPARARAAARRRRSRSPGSCWPAIVVGIWIDRGFGELSEERLAVLAATLVDRRHPDLLLLVPAEHPRAAPAGVVSAQGTRQAPPQPAARPGAPAAPTANGGGRRGARRCGACSRASARCGAWPGSSAPCCWCSCGSQLLQPREVLLGSNSVAGRDHVAEVPADSPCACRASRVPGGTGRVRFKLDTRDRPLPPLSVRVRTAGGTVQRGSMPGSPRTSLREVDVPINPLPPTARSTSPRSASRRRTTASSCGAARSCRSRSPAACGWATRRCPNRAALWFLPAGGRAQLDAVPAAGDLRARVAVQAAASSGRGCTGCCSWSSMPLLALRGDPPAGHGARRARVRAGARGRRGGVRQRRDLGAVTPSFQSPDESEHFAAVQYFGETGNAVDSRRIRTSRCHGRRTGRRRRRGASCSVVERAEAKPPWLQFQEDAWRAAGGRRPARAAVGQRRRLPPGDLAALAAVLRGERARVPGGHAGRRCSPSCT